VPVPRDPAATRPPAKRPDPTPADREKWIRRGELIALCYAELGSYQAVANAFGVSLSTVRAHVWRYQQQAKPDQRKIVDRLRGDVAALAVDRVQEALMEGPTMKAGELGRKVLHGLGELRSHSSIKNDGPASVTALQLTIVQGDPSRPPPAVIDGAVVGAPRSLGLDPQAPVMQSAALPDDD
jgi:hypothetical protein